MRAKNAEIIAAMKGLIVVLNYSHTPSALEANKQEACRAAQTLLAKLESKPKRNPKERRDGR